MPPQLSIILPAKNEADRLGELLKTVKSLYPAAELVVVNDGSDDDTGAVARQFADTVVEHPYSMGNGAAVKSGARAATGKTLVFMDADGQHAPADIARLLARLETGYDMVIGARDPATHANVLRRFANLAFNWLASLLTGRRIQDLTSGFRAARADKFRRFLYLLPNGFSYPTTITMAFLRTGRPIAYIPIKARQRSGKSHISPLRDGLRCLLIILKIGSLYSPFRLFVPLSAAVFLSGAGYYAYTFATMHRLTNMSVILFISALLIFLIGIVAEQISALLYLTSDQENSNTVRDKPRSPDAPD